MNKKGPKTKVLGEYRGYKIKAVIERKVDKEHRGRGTRYKVIGQKIEIFAGKKVVLNNKGKGYKTVEEALKDIKNHWNE